MLKLVALAVAGASLVLGAAAVAQSTNPSDTNNPPAASAPAAGAPSADQSGANASADTNTAGERG